MPIKNKKKARHYHKLYMRKWRRRKKEQAQRELLQTFPENQIEKKLPTVYELVFGKTKKKGKK